MTTTPAFTPGRAPIRLADPKDTPGAPHPESPPAGPKPGKLWLATRAVGFTLFALSITTLAGLYVVAAVGGAW